MAAKVEQAERVAMWGFVGSQSQQRWLWYAIDHHTGQSLAYVSVADLCNGSLVILLVILIMVIPITVMPIEEKSHGQSEARC